MGYNDCPECGRIECQPTCGVFKKRIADLGYVQASEKRDELGFRPPLTRDEKDKIQFNRGFNCAIGIVLELLDAKDSLDGRETSATKTLRIAVKALRTE